MWNIIIVKFGLKYTVWCTRNVIEMLSAYEDIVAIEMWMF